MIEKYIPAGKIRDFSMSGLGPFIIGNQSFLNYIAKDW